MTFARGRKIVVGLAALSLTSLLGACAADNPGAAVQSLGVTYSEADVTVVADQLSKLVGQQMPRNTVVQTLAQTEPILALADAVGMGITEEQFDSIGQMYVGQGSTIDPEDLSAPTKRVLAASAVSQSLGQIVSAQPQLYSQLMAMEQPPQTVVNPRYFAIGSDGLVPAGLLGDAFSTAGSADGAAGADQQGNVQENSDQSK